MKRIRAFLFILLSTFLTISPTNIPIEKVIIWGDKLHSHTHSYVNFAFHRAFKHMNYPTYWLDNKDDLSSLDLSNALFITEWQVDQKMPLRNDCFYLVLNNHASPRAHRYEQLKSKGHFINLRVYINKCLEMPHLIKLDRYTYCDLDKNELFIPWVTDLLPYEIDTIKKQLPIQRENNVWYIGSVGGGPGGNIQEIKPFMDECNKYGTPFRHTRGISMEENIKRIQSSYLAPAIQGTWQLQAGYIPCRIFKNISYGHIGITNSETVYKLFNEKIVYNSDSRQLYLDAKKRAAEITLEEQKELMDFVRDNHTYLNRIERIFQCFEILLDEKTNNAN